MLMRSKRRLTFVLFIMTCMAAAAGLSLYSLRDAVSYFYTPSEVAAMRAQGSAVVAPGRNFRVGGLVLAGSLKEPDDKLDVRFTITDMKEEQGVQYRGILPDLFREGQGVIARGHLDAAGLFIAGELLAKHDENYMPPEVAKGLKKVHDGMKGEAK